MRRAALILAMSVPTSVSAGTIYFTDFEADDGGWVASGEWALGTPSATPSGCDGTAPESDVGPNGAFSGVNAFATGLTTCYENSGATSTLTQSFDLSDVAEATLSWQQFVSVFVPFDTAEVTVNGTLVFERQVVGSDLSTDGYEFQEVDLTPFAGGTVEIQFALSASSVVNAYGWAIDDVRIESSVGAVPLPASGALLAIGLGLFAAVRRSR